MKKARKILALAMSLLMAASLGVTALADSSDTPGDELEMWVSMETEAGFFSVTCPTAMTAVVDEYGEATCADSVYIENHGFAPVAVKKLTVQSANGWRLYDFSRGDDTAIRNERVGSDYIGIGIQIGDRTTDDALTYAKGSLGLRGTNGQNTSSQDLYDASSSALALRPDGGCNVPSARHVTEEGETVTVTGKCHIVYDITVSPVRAASSEIRPAKAVFVVDWCE